MLISGDMQASSYPGRIIVTEPKGPVQPRINVDKQSARHVVINGQITISCIAQGNPVPTYRYTFIPHIICYYYFILLLLLFIFIILFIYMCIYYNVRIDRYSLHLQKYIYSVRAHPSMSNFSVFLSLSAIYSYVTFFAIHFPWNLYQIAWFPNELFSYLILLLLFLLLFNHQIQSKRWFKEENEQLLPLQLNERITIVSAGLLKILKVSNRHTNILYPISYVYIQSENGKSLFLWRECSPRRPKKKETRSKKKM